LLISQDSRGHRSLRIKLKIRKNIEIGENRLLLSQVMPSKNKISFLRNEVNMKNYKKIIGLIIVVFLLSASPANAENKWWEKGINIFKWVFPSLTLAQYIVVSSCFGSTF
jgi:hypothetical protein